jgi:hypothetical protein
MVTIEAPDCTSQFEGKVKEIIEPVGTTSAFAKNRVIFENIQTFKGDVGETVQLDILKNGPLKIEKGEDYLVQYRSGKICLISKKDSETH